MAEAAAERDVATCMPSLHLVMATNYGGRWDIARAARDLAVEVASGRLGVEDIDAARFGQQLSLTGAPAPDLLVRTGGDQRISNFPLWEAADAELYCSNTYWPDFGPAELDVAPDDCARRQRNYGGR